MDDFFDGWFKKVGWAIVNGYSDYAGQIPDLAVNAMAGPKRKPCRQIYRRMMILADGQVANCDQDFNNRVPVASLREQSLLSIWQTSNLRELRESHLAANYCPNPLCGRCRQWHRP
jgi:radical SAM protein with 4Fe4S-binding SPASM domain